jgi:hypothetical protein
MPYSVCPICVPCLYPLFICRRLLSNQSMSLLGCPLVMLYCFAPQGYHPVDPSRNHRRTPVGPFCLNLFLDPPLGDHWGTPLWDPFVSPPGTPFGAPLRGPTLLVSPLGNSPSVHQSGPPGVVSHVESLEWGSAGGVPHLVPQAITEYGSPVGCPSGVIPLEVSPWSVPQGVS